MERHHLPAEGWYHDPYEAHEHRWFSNGRPTSLVRDSGLEAHDAPPAEDCPGLLEPTAW